MYYGSGTVYRIASGLHKQRKLHALTRWQHLSALNDAVAAILKIGHVNPCILTWRTFQPNFIPIRFETTRALGFCAGLENGFEKPRFLKT